MSVTVSPPSPSPSPSPTFPSPFIQKRQIIMDSSTFPQLMMMYFLYTDCCGWIGLRRDTMTGDFQWISTGNPVRGSSSLWHEGYPSEGDRNCGLLDVNPPLLGLRNLGCSDTRYVFCQRNIQRRKRKEKEKIKENLRKRKRKRKLEGR